MSFLINALIRLGVLKDDLDCHLLRSSRVIIFFFFGYVLKIAGQQGRYAVGHGLSPFGLTTLGLESLLRHH